MSSLTRFARRSEPPGEGQLLLHDLSGLASFVLAVH